MSPTSWYTATRAMTAALTPSAPVIHGRTCAGAPKSQSNHRTPSTSTRATRTTDTTTFGGAKPPLELHK